MARSRNIKPGFFSNDMLAECEPLARILFAGLWCIADKSGRLEDRPKKIKAEVLPYDDCDADDLLSQLEKTGFIIRYALCNFNAIQILNFEKHQNPHVKEAESIIQAPDKNSSISIQELETHTTNPADSLLLIPDSLLPIPEEIQKPKKSSAFILPDWIDSETWNLWLKTRKKKMIPEQMQAQVKKLERWRKTGLNYAQALSDAAEAGWLGLQEPKNGINHRSIHDERANTIAELTGKNRKSESIDGTAVRVE